MALANQSRKGAYLHFATSKRDIVVSKALQTQYRVFSGEHFCQLLDEQSTLLYTCCDFLRLKWSSDPQIKSFGHVTSCRQSIQSSSRKHFLSFLLKKQENTPATAEIRDTGLSKISPTIDGYLAARQDATAHPIDLP